MNKILTIIVPVYKVEQYITKCLDSLILPPELMDLLEVIIVNDGTPDNSAEISREYVKRFPNTFSQIDKENGGHGSAWNVGLKEAHGKYLRFLDSDDWLSNLDTLMVKLMEIDVDLVFTHRVDYFVDNNQYVLRKNQGPFNKIELISSLNPLRFADHIGICSFWHTTYKTELLQQQYPLFLEKVRYDDSILFTLPLLLATTYVVLDFEVYYYLLGRDGQSMNPIQMRLHLEERINTYIYQYQRLKQISNQTELPDNVLHSLTGQVVTLIDLCSHSNYKHCLLLRKIIPNAAPVFYDEYKNKKLVKRYNKFSLPIFWVIQHCRRILSNIKN